MKTKIFLLALLVFISLSSCGDDKDEPNSQINNGELSIDPYFKYVGLSLDEIQSDFSVSLEYNGNNYYLNNQWIYNNLFNVIFWVTSETTCSTVHLKMKDEKATSFEHYKLFTKEAFSSLGEPKSTAFLHEIADGHEVLFQIDTPHKKGAYDETISFAEKNNILKIGNSCEMVWEKNGYKIKYHFSSEISEIYHQFRIIITKI